METVTNILNWLGTLLKAAQLMPDFDSARGIFCAIAWVATLLSAGLFLLSLFADVVDGDADGMDASAADGDTGLFSTRALIGFLLGFGWGGYIAVINGSSIGMGIAVGLLVGLLMFFLVAGIMRFIYSLKSDGTLDYGSLVGCTGTVYVTIPPNGEPGGQVQVSHPGQLLTMPAIQEGSEPLPAQTRIQVVQASTFQLVVKPLTFPQNPQQ